MICHLLADAGDHLSDVDRGPLGSALAHDERAVVARETGHAVFARCRPDVGQDALRMDWLLRPGNTESSIVCV